MNDYWKRVNPYGIPLDADAVSFAVNKFMDNGRAADLMALVTQSPQIISSAQIVRILEEAPQTLGGQRHDNDLVMFQHHVEMLLAILDQRADVDEAQIARLEWLYFSVLRHSGRSLQTLHKVLSESPDFFVEVLNIVYRSSANTDSTEQNTDAESHQRFVTQAYQLLESWRAVPGMHNGTIDGAKLESWVAEVRRRAMEVGRINPCDACIGKVLAWAPIGDDGVWPAMPVRHVIEISRSEIIEGSIAGGVLNKRGVTARNPADGGALEKGDAAQYRAWSDALRYKSPRTSIALENIAKVFDDIADGQDQMLERASWS
jgi:hypothetical protein